MAQDIGIVPIRFCLFARTSVSGKSWEPRIDIWAKSKSHQRVEMPSTHDRPITNRIMACPTVRRSEKMAPTCSPPAAVFERIVMLDLTGSGLGITSRCLTCLMDEQRHCATLLLQDSNRTLPISVRSGIVLPCLITPPSRMTRVSKTAMIIVWLLVEQRGVWQADNSSQSCSMGENLATIRSANGSGERPSCEEWSTSFRFLSNGLRRGRQFRSLWRCCVTT